MGATFVRANGITFAYQALGPRDGPLALCLHGFPDTPATWRHLLPQLAAAGFRAVAPWMRGYAPTEVPAQRRTAPDTLAADANALHRALGGDRHAVLIGHDWGALAASRAAAAAPQRWRRLVTMAVPPEQVLAAARAAPRQMRRSWYAVQAAAPGAERRLVDDGFAVVRQLWRRWSPGYQPEPADLQPLAASLRGPGVPRAVLSYYRGVAAEVARGRALSAKVPLPPQPHLVLHGRDDGCIGAEWAQATVGRLPHPASRVEVLDATGHFLHLETPDRVGDLVLAHLGSAVRTAPRTRDP